MNNNLIRLSLESFPYCTRIIKQSPIIAASICQLFYSISNLQRYDRWIALFSLMSVEIAFLSIGWLLLTERAKSQLLLMRPLDGKIGWE